MNVSGIIKQLTDERNRIDEAIRLLSNIGSHTSPAARPTNGTRKKRKPLSAEARARIAAAQRKRWAKQKKGV
jgi:hypothetical protein